MSRRVRAGDSKGQEVNRPKHSSVQATAYSRMLLSQTGCVMVLSHVEKQHLVCLQVAEALITRPHMSWPTILLTVRHIHKAK